MSSITNAASSPQITLGPVEIELIKDVNNKLFQILDNFNVIKGNVEPIHKGMNSWTVVDQEQAGFKKILSSKAEKASVLYAKASSEAIKSLNAYKEISLRIKETTKKLSIDIETFKKANPEAEIIQSTKSYQQWIAQLAIIDAVVDAIIDRSEKSAKEVDALLALEQGERISVNLYFVTAKNPFITARTPRVYTNELLSQILTGPVVDVKPFLKEEKEGVAVKSSEKEAAVDNSTTAVGRPEFSNLKKRLREKVRRFNLIKGKAEPMTAALKACAKIEPKTLIELIDAKSKLLIDGYTENCQEAEGLVREYQLLSQEVMKECKNLEGKRDALSKDQDPTQLNHQLIQCRIEAAVVNQIYLSLIPRNEIAAKSIENLMREKNQLGGSPLSAPLNRIYTTELFKRVESEIAAEAVKKTKT